MLLIDPHAASGCVRPLHVEISLSLPPRSAAGGILAHWLSHMLLHTYGEEDSEHTLLHTYSEEDSCNLYHSLFRTREVPPQGDHIHSSACACACQRLSLSPETRAVSLRPVVYAPTQVCPLARAPSETATRCPLVHVCVCPFASVTLLCAL
jgi:hypothetical protein